MIIQRFSEIEQLKKIKVPLLVYGRRKTGKTFLVKNFFKEQKYFFVRRDRSIYYENLNEVVNYKELLRIIREEKKSIIVVDEFHRLPEEFLDYLHIKAPENIVLVTSTLYLAKKLIAEKSPILGLFLEYRVKLIDELDILLNLKKKIKNKRNLVEYCVYLREPIFLRFSGLNLFEILKHLKITVPALISEIFLEEDRELSERYEGILRAVASGKNNLSQITSFLYSNNLIEKEDISTIKPYLKILRDIGLINRMPEFKSKRYYYFISSPILDLYYYLDEKYNFSERELDEKYFYEKLPKYVEFFIRDLFSKIYKKRVFIINRPDLEIDIALGDFQKINLVVEVKWGKSINMKEIRKIEEKLNKFQNTKKILFVPDKRKIKVKIKNIEVWDITDVLKLIKKN